jgi:hypothetical protein
VSTWLVDAGPLIAYLDPTDASHQKVSQVMDRFTGRTVTTAAVITEAMHFVAGARGGPMALADLVSGSGMVIPEVCQPADLREAARLMERYSDTPMDFADATLVLLGGALDMLDILTLDRRGFSTFRTRDGRAFRLVLDATQLRA